MKLKLFDINRAQPALQKLLTKELPIRTAFQISRLGKTIQDIFDSIEEQRSKLVRKFGTESNGLFKVVEKNLGAFSQEFGELLQEEIEVNFNPVSIELLGDIKLTALDMLALEPFITVEES